MAEGNRVELTPDKGKSVGYSADKQCLDSSVLRVAKIPQSVIISLEMTSVQRLE